MEHVIIDIIPMIMEFMNYIGDIMFSLMDDPRLAEVGMKLIERTADNAEANVVEQLGYDPRD